MPNRGRDERCAPREIRPVPALNVDLDSRIRRPTPARSHVAPDPGGGRVAPRSDVSSPPRIGVATRSGGPAPSRRRHAGGEGCDGVFLSICWESQDDRFLATDLATFATRRVAFQGLSDGRTLSRTRFGTGLESVTTKPCLQAVGVFTRGASHGRVAPFSPLTAPEPAGRRAGARRANHAGLTGRESDGRRTAEL